MRADHNGRPPLHSVDTLGRIEALQSMARALALESQGPRPLLLGRHLIELGQKPGPQFKPLLDEAFEAQLDGKFDSESDAREWLKKRLQDRPSEIA